MINVINRVRSTESAMDRVYTVFIDQLPESFTNIALVTRSERRTAVADMIRSISLVSAYNFAEEMDPSIEDTLLSGPWCHYRAQHTTTTSDE